MTLETWLAFFVAKFLRVPRQLRFINRLFGGLCAAALLATFKRAG